MTASPGAAAVMRVAAMAHNPEMDPADTATLASELARDAVRASVPR